MVIFDEVREELRATLRLIAIHDLNYEIRYGLVMKALYLATALGYAAGIGFDIKEPRYPVVYIELPTGQVSWHVPEYARPWDGHSTEEKYKRINEFVV